MLKKIYEIPFNTSIVKFLSKFRRVYVYGAGKYGSTTVEFFHDTSITISGVIVSKKNEEYICGCSIYEYDEVLDELNDDVCVILAMKEKFQLEVIKQMNDSIGARFISIIKHKEFKKFYYGDYVTLMNNLSRNHPCKRYDNRLFNEILIIRLDRMGDMIWTSPFLRELRSNYPKSHITLVCTTANELLLKFCPYVDRVLGYEYTSDEELGKLPNHEVLNRAKEYAEGYLNDVKYDVVFLPRGMVPFSNMANIYLAVFSSASVRVGCFYQVSYKVEDWYRELMNKLFSVVAEHEYPVHDIIKALGLLKAIGRNVLNDDTEVWYRNNDMIAGASIDELLTLRRKYNFWIAVGIATQPATRTWNPRYYKKLFSMIKEKFSVCFLLLGGISSKDNAQIACDTDCCIDYTGKTNVHDVMNIISMCDLYLGSDTGLKHIAASLKKPVIEISAAFPWGDDDGGLSPKHCGAWNTKYVVLYPDKPEDIECAKAGCCVEEYSHCINNVTVESVQETLEYFLLYYDFSGRK